MAAVAVTFSFTEDEAKALARRSLYRNPRLRVIGVLAMVAMVGIGVLALSLGATLLGVVWLVLAVVYVGLLLAVPYLAVERRGVRTQASPARTYAFDDDAISTRVGDASATIPWGAVHGAALGRRFWRLEVGARRQRLVIPVRAFASEADATAVRELVRRHVRRGASAAETPT